MPNTSIEASFLILTTPYQLLYYTSLFILCVNTIICMYYSLPLNQFNEKYIPSVNEVLRWLPRTSDSNVAISNKYNTLSHLHYHWKCLEAFIDWLLLILLVIILVQGKRY